MNNSLDAAVLVSVLFGCGLYLCLSRRLLRVLFGFIMVSNAANLVLLAISGDPAGREAPLIDTSGQRGAVVDPLPQALILTAIVIGFAVAAYLTVLVYRLYTDRGVASVPALFSTASARPGSPAAREEAEATRARSEKEDGA